jgi:hypothetical protein
VKDLIKRLLLPGGARLRRLRGGVSRDQLMTINLRTQLQRYLGLDERELADIVRTSSSRCRTLVDIGANDGYYTVAFLASAAECVIACEPGPANKELIENAMANGHHESPRFQVERRLIGTNSGEATILALLHGRPLPAFVKVDVDSGEVDVLRSAESFSHLPQTSWVVETHSLELENKCIEWFASHGFQSRVIKPAWWRILIPERRPLEQNRWLFATPDE